MDELIKTSVNEQDEIIVSGRELYEFLEVKTKYADWFERMCGYGFVENIDYIEFWSNLKNENAQLSKEEAAKYSSQKLSALGYEKHHALKIDMAKEISMIQRSEKGKQARLYFIETEKKYRAQQQLPGDPITLALKAALETRAELKEVKTDVEQLKDNLAVTSGQAKALNKKVSERVYLALGGKDTPACAELKKKTYSACWRDFKALFNIVEYRDLPRIKFNAGMQFLEEWTPDATLRFHIKQANQQGTLF